MIFVPKGVEFKVELWGTKKCLHQKLPKQLDSNGRSVVYLKVQDCTYEKEPKLTSK